MTVDWFSLGWGMFFLWGRDEEKGSRTREPEMKGACNMASYTSYSLQSCARDRDGSINVQLLTCQS